ncbi:hypothetical protein [Streptomyces brasiliscabiei]|uniref:hypothetical protein n=1 Tax=Streptomyces brasiliscabiei TaxID=2736302 RepID=UPI001C10EBDA|nr:hypothetical protein [Streptomyces brasiliscabiei]
MALVHFLTTFALPALNRVSVNFNALTEDGLVRVRRSRFPHKIRVGGLVQVFEPDDEIEGFATVARINERAGLVYLDVAWDSLRDIEIAHTEEVPDVDAGPTTSPPPASWLKPQLVSR